MSFCIHLALISADSFFNFSGIQTSFLYCNGSLYGQKKQKKKKNCSHFSKNKLNKANALLFSLVITRNNNWLQLLRFIEPTFNTSRALLHGASYYSRTWRHGSRTNKAALMNEKRLRCENTLQPHRQPWTFMSTSDLYFITAGFCIILVRKYEF